MSGVGADAVDAKLDVAISRTKIASYVIGALALAMLIVSVFLLVFVRQRSSNTIHPSTSVTPTPGPAVIPKMVGLQPFATSNSIFSAADMSKLVSVSTGIITPSVSCNTVVNGSCIQPSPVYEPGEVPFNTTLTRPVQVPVEGFGWCAITPDADQWMTSAQNGLAVFGQYIIDSSSTTGTVFKFYSDPYSSGGNQLLFSCASASDGSNANVDASAVGSVGFRSIAISPDSTRLYVAYRQPFMGQPPNNSAIFPFLQLIGRVGVFTRTPDATTSIQNPSASSTAWTYSCDLALSNPFGSQTAGLSTICDTVTLVTQQSDNYGAAIRSSYNYTNSNRMVAIRSQFGYLLASGAIVTVYEELPSGTHQLVGTLQLQTGYVPLIDAATLAAQKKSFGSTFALFNDVCICSVRVRTGGCSNASSNVNQLIVFVRNTTTLIWEFKQLIGTPDATKDFGSGVETNGSLLVVSAPTFGTYNFSANPRTAGTTGVGGAIYLYKRSGTTFTLTQTVPDPTVGAYGAFGSYISVDPQFLVVAITYNQDNSPDKPAVQITPASKTSGVLFLAIDLINSVFGPLDKAQTVEQSYLPQDIYDQTFGANMALSFKSHKQSTLVALVNSPANQRVTVYTMNVGT